MSNANYTQVNNSALSRSVLNNAQRDVNKGRFQIHAAAGTLTQAEIEAAINGMLVVDTSAANHLQVGADTAANALDLQNAFGIPNLNDTVLLRILSFRAADATAAVNLANTSASNNFVDVNLTYGANTGDADTQVLFSNASLVDVAVGAEALVLVQNTSVTAAAQSIRFSIIQQGGSNATS